MLALKYREAILAIPKSEFPWRTSFRQNQFPRGCCGDTSRTLATYIYDDLGFIFGYATGRNGGNSSGIGSHAWLELDDLVIDITAVQFKNRGHSFLEVYVGPKTD